jgi:hypothetical protein
MVSLSNLEQQANQLWRDIEDAVLAKQIEIEVNNQNGKSKLLRVEDNVPKVSQIGERRL